MTHYEPNSVERTELPDAVDALGIDGDGRTHYITTPVGGLTIYVETGDGFDVFEVDDMPIGDLEDWIDHVEATRSWNRLCYNTDGLGAWLADSLQEAV